MGTRMDKELRKAKKIYTFELLAFVVIFLTLGILILTKVWVLGGNLRLVFAIITMVGTTWAFADFIWMLASKKRRAKNSMLDKVLLLPLAIAIFVIDIITFVQGIDATRELHQYAVGSAFSYIALIYSIEAIYHWYHPLPMIVEAAKEDKKKEEAPVEPLPAPEEIKEENIEEKKTEE